MHMPTPKTNAESWIQLKEATRRYNISLRQLQRYVQAGRIKREFVIDRASKRQFAMLRVEDLERMQHDRAAGTAPLPPAVNVPARMLMKPVPLQAQALTLPRPSSPDYAPEPPSPPRTWCTIAEAATWSGLPQAWLRRAAEAGKICAIDVSPSRRKIWRINRQMLDQARDFSICTEVS